MIQGTLQLQVHIANDAEDIPLSGLVQKAEYVVVILTRGCLGGIDFAVSIVTAAQNKNVNFVPVCADTCFTYPGADFWKNFTDGDVIDQSAPCLLSCGVDLPKIADIYKQFFTILSLPFSAHGGWSIQKQEVS